MPHTTQTLDHPTSTPRRISVPDRKLRHVVEAQQFTLPLLLELFNRSRGMERVVSRGGTLDLQNKIMATLFYQPSTRTRFSFEAAMHRLGGRVLSTEHARSFSSEMDGEQVEDSIRIVGSYSDVIVIRHHEEGGAHRAAQVSPVHVINAGDGNGGQHPTQALLDLYTIYRERPLDGLSVAIIGELDKGRTARSLALWDVRRPAVVVEVQPGAVRESGNGAPCQPHVSRDSGRVQAVVDDVDLRDTVEL